jgi:hypothetical protein
MMVSSNKPLRRLQMDSLMGQARGSSFVTGASDTKVRVRERYMRILICYEESYRTYSDVLQRAIGALRPEADVVSCRLAELGEQVESFNPHLVVSSGKNTVDPGGRAAWYMLSPEPGEPSEACLSGRRTHRTNPPLEDLLSFIDEAEALVRSGHEV